ncbi:MAG: rod shape-determining protein MreC, partial [Novosphingobium sp.]
MVPPSNRRGGYSRRAQYSVFTGYMLAAIGALVGAILLVVSLIHPAAFSGLRGVASDLGAPVGKAGAAGRAGTQKTINTVSGFIRMGTQNAKLREENEIARVRLAEAKAVAQENKRLKALLGLDDGDLKPVARARLIGSTASSTRRFAYLSAGSSDGVKPGMPVRSARGLVGRVLETGTDSARVLLLTDTESLVPVRRAKDNVVAFAEGRADGTLRLRLVNLGIN